MAPPETVVVERKKRLTKRFKVAIIAATALAVSALGLGTESGRYTLSRGKFKFQWVCHKMVAYSVGAKWEPEIADIETLRERETAHNIREAIRKYREVFEKADPEFQHLLEISGMSPHPGENQLLICPGNINWGLILSSHVYEAHDTLSYRLKPNRRSFFLHDVSLPDGLTGIFHLPYRPDVLDAVDLAGLSHRIARNDRGEIAIHSTNSRGLRGAEFDSSVPFTVQVIGDSYMQGFMIDDQDTPVVRLQQYLANSLQTAVSVRNVSIQGWGPKEYFAAMQQYWDDHTDLIVVSLCPNDFGDGFEVMQGRGNDWERAKHYLRAIHRQCVEKRVICLFCPVPGEWQLRVRMDAHYPGRIANMLGLNTERYCYPIEAFADADIQLRTERRRQGEDASHSSLYNGQFNDGHFSPDGARVWARAVGERVVAILRARENASDKPSPDLPKR